MARVKAGMMSLEKLPTEVLSAASRRYGVSARDLKLVYTRESGDVVFLFQYQAANREFVLKLIKHVNEDKQTVRASLESELDWINYLADHGINTPRGVISQQGNYVELIDLDQGAFFSVVSSEKAGGRQITPEDFGAALFTKIGRLTGKIHALTKHYQPGQHVQKRPEWHEDEYLDIANLIPATDSQLLEKSWELVNRLKNFPRDAQSYGLVHGDLQEHNLRLSQGEITILDFESSIYCWYILDFVSSLEGVIGDRQFGAEMEAMTMYFSENYWRGYHEENTMDRFYLQQVPEFFKLWELFLYSEFINEWDLTNLTEARKQLLHNYRTDMINTTRFVNIDFERFYDG